MGKAPEENARDPFDRKARRAVRTRAARGYADFAFLKDSMAADLAERAAGFDRTWARVLDLGAHDGRLGHMIPAEHVLFADPSEAFVRGTGGVVCDEDRLPFADGSFDLVLSALSLHGVGDLPGALVQLRRVLRPGGVMLTAFVGGNSLGSLRRALAEAEIEATGAMAPRFLPTVDAASAPGLLQRAGFAEPVVDIHTLRLTYRDVAGMLRDVRGMGEGNFLAARQRRPLSRAMRARFELAVEAALGPPPYPVELDILTLTGKAPGG